MSEQVDVLQQLTEIEASGLAALETAQDEKDLAAWRTAHLGRSAPVMQIFGGLGRIPAEQRAAVGQRANAAKLALEAAHTARVEALKARALTSSLETERLDVTLPGRQPDRARLHPTSATLRQSLKVFSDMGFQIFRSPDVETDEYNFQLLNFPPNHPARDMQDTFYIQSAEDCGDNPILMRTQTSPGQVRAMRAIAALDPQNPPPVRVAIPGMCYRYEQVTARSEVQFNQIEGLAVGRNITLADLKGTLNEFARRMFGANVRTRFRAHYFPFTEPSGEMDVECFVCGGVGCTICKRTGWLEILGCGMVHPIVLQNGGYDPAIYSGYAFGMGPERLSILRHRIEDIRNFWLNDVRFLEQF